MNANSFMQVRVQKKYFFEFKFKFEFGKMIEFIRVQVRVRSPGLDNEEFLLKVSVFRMYNSWPTSLPVGLLGCKQHW